MNKNYKNNKKTKKKLIENKKKFIKTLSVILAVVVIITSSLFIIDSFAPANPKCYDKFFLSAFNGSYDKKGLPKNYWEVSPITAKVDGKTYSQSIYAKYYLTYESGNKTNQIWINVSDFHNSSTKIEICQGGGISSAFNKDTYFYTLTRKTVNNSQDGWIKIFDANWDNAIEITSSNVWIGFKDAKIRIREVAFLDSTGLIFKNSTNALEGLYDENGKVNNFGGIDKNLKNTVDEYSLTQKRFNK